jgi:farnesyl-diphosphate farnesyltransferase
MKSLETLLIKTSRTFSLAITLLPPSLRHQVTVAYLLFRIADTLEDCALWPARMGVEALEDFARAIEAGDLAQIELLARRWTARPPVDHAGYVELLREARFVCERLEVLPPPAREVIRAHLLRTTRGMADFVAASEATGSVQLESLEDLSRYCYVVAGVVGEMLTELALLHAPQLASVEDELRSRAARFGEALQLVNIVKDRQDDAGENRRYLPQAVPIAEVFALARADLAAAAEYAAAIERGGAVELRTFHLLLVRLAQATLARVEQGGAGAKLTRVEVLQILASCDPGAADELGLASG